MLNVLLVLSRSLDTVSAVSLVSPYPPPMMTMLLLLNLQTLDIHLQSVRVRGSVTQPPCSTFHCMQLLGVSHPPHSVLPAWTWPYLSSGSEGSSQVEFCHGRNISSDCSAPFPPVIRIASEMERFICTF